MMIQKSKNHPHNEGYWVTPPALDTPIGVSPERIASADEASADREIRQGRVRSFENMDALIDDLDADGDE